MQLYHGMCESYGERKWWPAETVFEIVVGAVLTQNTAWTNVEKAIANLKQADALSLELLSAMPLQKLAVLIRPSGYFNVKAKRLNNLCNYLSGLGGLEKLDEMPLELARAGLLSVNGVGPETADDILLYALNRPVFVIDTYTRRLLTRNALARGSESYEELRAGFERALPADVDLFKQYHALVVEHAKQACRKKPICEACGLQQTCPKQFS